MINIIFYSSLSSKMGAELALLNDCDNMNKTNMFIRLWPRASKDNFENPKINKILEVLIKNNYARLIIPLALIMISVLFPGVRIYLPRPNWIRGNLFENLIIGKFIYYGDGFSLYCATKKPYWLMKVETVTNKTNGKFIYSYSLDNENKDDCNNVKIKKDKVIEYLSGIKYDNQTYEKIIKLTKTEKLLIVPTTTFYKTGRMSLNQEIDLYEEAINKIIKECACSKFLIKFHPASTKYVVNEYYEKFGKNKFLIKMSVDDSMELANFPIEILLRDIQVPYILMITSSGVAFAASISGCKDVKLCFGEKLLKKYIKEEYLKSRIKQELEIGKLLYE